jgi:hypothetical protein
MAFDGDDAIWLAETVYQDWKTNPSRYQHLPEWIRTEFRFRKLAEDSSPISQSSSSPPPPIRTPPMQVPDEPIEPIATDICGREWSVVDILDREG